MIHAYLWNTVTSHGVYIDPSVKTNIASLQSLVNSLESHSATFVAMNEEGIIISDEELRGRVEGIFSKILSIDTCLMSQDTRLEVLEGKYGTSSLEQRVENPPEKDETGEALYIMWDLLPEELKKKLIIYIKKL